MGETINSNCEYRLLNAADADSFFNLRSEALLDSPRAFGMSHEEHCQMEQEIRGKVSHPNILIMGACAPELVGMVGFIRNQGIKKQHKGIIWGVYVTPKYRKSGTSKALLAKMIEHCRTLEGLEELQLSVAADNLNAKHLYLSLGFQPYGFEARALKIDGAYVDEELMSLSLV